MRIHRTHGIPTGEGMTPTLQLPLAPRFELTDMPADNSGTRQCAFDCNSLDDEQWSDDLFDPSSPARR